MAGINYQVLMEHEIEQIEKAGKTPRLLLHACCAPCSSSVLKMLCQHFDVTIFYYNPNISPQGEFDKRLRELIRLCDQMPLAKQPRIIPGDYEPEAFDQIASGLEDLPEGGERCFACYRLRLRKTAQLAREQGFDYFTTTLSVSPHKNAEKLNQIGAELAQEFGVPYLFSDFKKKDGYLRSIRLSQEYHLYRQSFCGCIYSQLQAKREGRE